MLVRQAIKQAAAGPQLIDGNSTTVYSAKNLRSEKAVNRLCQGIQTQIYGHVYEPWIDGRDAKC